MPPSEGYGAATFNMKTGEKVAQYGNQYVTQNQSAGNLLIIHRVLNLLFTEKLNRSQTFTPDPDNEAITASQLKMLFLLKMTKLLWNTFYQQQSLMTLLMH